MGRASKTFRDQPIRLTDLVSTDGVLDGYTFEGCLIKGPAVVIPKGSTGLVGNNLGGSNSNVLLWEIPPTRPRVIGAVIAKDCVFRSCDFDNVGFAGDADFIKMFRQSMGE